MPQGDGSTHRFNALIKLVSVAGIELALQRPKRRVIPFHYTEILGALGETRTPRTWFLRPVRIPFRHRGYILVLTQTLIYSKCP